MASVTLVDEMDGRIHRTVSANHSKSGGLVIEIQDLGPGASLTGDEYECWYRVSTPNLEVFCELLEIDASRLLADLHERYSGSNFGNLAKLMGDSQLVKFDSHW